MAGQLRQGLSCVQASEAADTDAQRPLQPPQRIKAEPSDNPEQWHAQPSRTPARCRVIVEGDPQPAQAGCRMQFSGSAQAAPDPEVRVLALSHLPERCLARHLAALLQIERLAQLRTAAPSNHADRFFSEPAERPASAKQAAKRKQQHGHNAALPAAKQRKQ